MPSGREGCRSLARLRRLAWDHAGVVRTGEGLGRLLDALDGFERSAGLLGGEGRNLLLAARLVARAALERTESRGGHFRADHPAPAEGWRRHLAVELEPSRGGEAAVRLTPLPLPGAGRGTAEGTGA